MAILTKITRDNITGAGVRFTFDTTLGTLEQVDVMTKDNPLTIQMQGANSGARTFTQDPNLTKSYDVSVDVMDVVEVDTDRGGGVTKVDFQFRYRVRF